MMCRNQNILELNLSYLQCILGSHSGDYEEFLALECTTVDSQPTFATCFALVSYLAYSSTLKMDAIFSPEARMAFGGLLGII
jgi:hypothetical protein